MQKQTKSLRTQKELLQKRTQALKKVQKYKDLMEAEYKNGRVGSRLQRYSSKYQKYLSQAGELRHQVDELKAELEKDRDEYVRQTNRRNINADRQRRADQDHDGSLTMVTRYGDVEEPIWMVE